MSRPADLSKYVEGDPCPKCAGTMYRRKTVCVECERRANARRYAERTGIDYVEPAPRPNISPTKLSSALEGYRRSPSARERSARLDALILGKKLDQGDAAPMTTAGQLWRSMLPVGYKAPIGQGVNDQQRTADVAAFKDAMNQIYGNLPGIVRTQDVAARLPAVIVRLMGPRLLLQIAKYLVEQGATPREIGLATKRTAKRVYVLDPRLVGLRRGVLYDRYYKLIGAERPVAEPDCRKGRAARGTEQKSKIANSNNKLRDAQPPSLPGSSRNSAQSAHVERSTAPSA
jgi:hypothetical protein